MRYVHTFKQFLFETFLPKNIEKREEVFDRMVKQKEESGELVVDHRPREVKIFRSKEEDLVNAEIVRRNPFSSSIIFMKKNSSHVLCELVFFLHATFADERKKNNYEPYKLDDIEMWYRLSIDAGKIKLLLDDNLKKLIENACKLIYEYGKEPNKVKKYKKLSQEVIEMALQKGLLLEQNHKNVS